MKLQLFTATAFVLGDNLPEVKGLSHWGEQGTTKVSWYPFSEYTRRVFFFAPNRTKAVKQLERAGVHFRDLSDGRGCANLLCDSIRTQFAPPS